MRGTDIIHRMPTTSQYLIALPNIYELKGVDMSKKLSAAARRLVGYLEGLSDEWDTFESEKYWVHGGTRQRDRLEKVAEWCAATWPGDLVEIGCLTGAMTVRLARIAARHGRRVIAVDPWTPGIQECKDGDYERFLANIKPHRDRVDVMRLPSQNEEVKAIVKKRELCFTLIDGLHTGEAVSSDILTVAHAQIIAVDEVLHNAKIRSAFVQGARQTGKTPVNLVLWREGYLVSNAALKGRLPA
jgi:hypothetical protein